jgi:hypothetical protein
MGFNEELSPNLRIRDYIGPVADPAPYLLRRWLEHLAADQIRVVLEKEIDQKINAVKFNIQNLNMELEKLETMKTMLKTKGMANK